MTGQMQRIALASRPVGDPKPENFSLETGPIPTPGAGEILVEVLWLSLDPYMRGRMDDAKSYAASVGIGDTMEAGCVARVLESNFDGLAPGDIVEHRFGWCSHAVAPGKDVRKVDPTVAPISTAVGVLGMPGLTAWHGFNKIGQPKAGETLVVGAATGAVGSLVGQLAKAAGLRAVGVAGGAEKCAFAVEELGFDACIDHRSGDAKAIREQLAAACPNGIDIYFENVGGKTMEAVLPLMNVWGRIPICGMISYYSGAEPGALDVPRLWRSLLVNRLHAQGFIIFDHWDEFPEFVSEVAPMIADGRIKYRESIAEGLENAPDAFMKMLKGGNFGKQLVRVKPETA
ncbi:NADP-dependent oxidoreductase [Rhodovulum sp. DZ06]|uniref:NADP-dependent oxidoreductase n=1 Tax=Rhodovulum sp. DZ06 TaxID=3425126 RepID=UPI003D3399E5